MTVVEAQREVYEQRLPKLKRALETGYWETRKGNRTALNTYGLLLVEIAIECMERELRR